MGEIKEDSSIQYLGSAHRQDSIASEQKGSSKIFNGEDDNKFKVEPKLEQENIILPAKIGSDMKIINKLKNYQRDKGS